MASIKNKHLEIVCGEKHLSLWTCELKASGTKVEVLPPQFDIDNKRVSGEVTGVRLIGYTEAGPGIFEHVFEGSFASDPHVVLRIRFRLAEDSPVVRFRYELTGPKPFQMTKSEHRERTDYVTLSAADHPRAWEVRLSEFNDLIHAYGPSENELTPAHFNAQVSVMGPILAVEGDGSAFLLAYEHGSQYPDAFLEFALFPERSILLRGVKGNYCRGQECGKDRPFESPWFHFGMVRGGMDAMASAYRDFILKAQNTSPESRKPRICYNTWNSQERDKYLRNRDTHDRLTEASLLKDIDLAHQAGIEVYVVDSGWFGVLGDWEPDPKRFPRGLKPLKDRLDEHGMKLGLWFNPNTVSVRSRIYEEYRDCEVSWPHSKPAGDDRRMCLASRYAEAMVNDLIRVMMETGVRLFKWDGLHQYGCDSAHHEHGSAKASPGERADRFSFLIPLVLARMAGRIQKEFPDAVIDLDVTEADRCLGLAFLSAGRYSLMNNGPYLQNLNLPVPGNGNWNAFFQPGPARGWVCRAGAAYDRWIPAHLFLTHHFPDDTEPLGWTVPLWGVRAVHPMKGREALFVSLASLIVSGNGLWGELDKVSPESRNEIREFLSVHARVRDEAAASAGFVEGRPGGSPEIHERIDPGTGRGFVAVFSNQIGSFRYLTRRKAVDSTRVFPDRDGARVVRQEDGRALVTADFRRPGTRVVFFGV